MSEVRVCRELCCTKIENLGVRMGALEALKDVNLHIHCGELTAIIGPNGAGKSTLLKAILGEVKHSGRVKFVKSSGKEEVRPAMGYVPQTPVFAKDSPITVLDLFVSCVSRFPAWLPIPNRLKRKVEEALTGVKAEHLMNRRLGALSGGELQRVLLALALLPVPQLLLLDEPVSGIDSSGMDLFYKIVNDVRKEYDLSIILVTHDLDMIKDYADRVVLLEQSVLLNGNPQEVYSHEIFRKTFNKPEGKDRGMVVSAT